MEVTQTMNKSQSITNQSYQKTWLSPDVINVCLMILISYLGLFSCLEVIIIVALNTGFPVVW